MVINIATEEGTGNSGDGASDAQDETHHLDRGRTHGDERAEGQREQELVHEKEAVIGKGRAMRIDFPRKEITQQALFLEPGIMARLEIEDDAADGERDRDIEGEPTVRRVLEHTGEGKRRICAGHELGHDELIVLGATRS